MHTLVIHMPGSTERRLNVDTILKVLPDAHEVEAVDGRAEGAAKDVTLCPGDLHQPAYPFDLLPGEVGCFLSHRKCWQRILDEGWDYALIVEDDLALNLRVFDQLIDILKRNATPDSFIRIPPKDREGQHKVTDQEGGLKIVTPRVIGLQTTAQLVGRNAAKRLLLASHKIDRPVDTFLQMHWITGQPVQSVLPVVVLELSFAGKGSTVQQKKTGGLSAKLAREWNRASYRSKIRNYPQTSA